MEPVLRSIALVQARLKAKAVTVPLTVGYRLVQTMSGTGRGIGTAIRCRNVLTLMAINVEQTADRRTQRDRIDTVQNQVVSISGNQVYKG